MLSYYGYTISPNQIETGEGFLICRNVPIARTGTQEYMMGDWTDRSGRRQNYHSKAGDGGGIFFRCFGVL